MPKRVSSSFLVLGHHRCASFSLPSFVAPSLSLFETMHTEERVTHLLPPLFATGAVEGFAKSGKSLSLALSPRDDTIAIHASLTVCQRWNYGELCEWLIITSSLLKHCVHKIPHAPPRSSRSILQVCTRHLCQNGEWYVIQFAHYPSDCDLPPVHNRHLDHLRSRSESVEGGSGQEHRIVSSTAYILRARTHKFTTHQLRLQSENEVQALNKLANDYINFCKECCMYASVCLDITFFRSATAFNFYCDPAKYLPP